MSEQRPFRGLTSENQYRKATAEVDRLERLVKSGAATEEDRERYRTGADLVLIWEWAAEGKRFREENRR